MLLNLEQIKVLSIVFAILVILDSLWLGVITRAWRAALMAQVAYNQHINWAAGVVAWLLLAHGITLMVLPVSDSLLSAALNGARFGAVVYGVYQLTNYAIMAHWPRMFVLVDIMWGTVLCTATSALSYYALMFV